MNEFIIIVGIIFSILSIILFFKLWGMTNDVKEMKNIMELFLRKDFQHKDNLEEQVPNNIINNIEFDKEDFPPNTKFNKGDTVLYNPENTILIVIGYISPNIFKCKTIDGTNKTFCFQEEYLDKSE